MKRKLRVATLAAIPLLLMTGWVSYGDPDWVETWMLGGAATAAIAAAVFNRTKPSPTTVINDNRVDFGSGNKLDGVNVDQSRGNNE